MLRAALTYNDRAVVGLLGLQADLLEGRTAWVIPMLLQLPVGNNRQARGRKTSLFLMTDNPPVLLSLCPDLSQGQEGVLHSARRCDEGFLELLSIRNLKGDSGDWCLDKEALSAVTSCGSLSLAEKWWHEPLQRW